jgi:AraC family transcriptional activator of pobA
MKSSPAAAPARFPVSSRTDLSLEVEAQTVQSALDIAQWTLHGRRHRAFVLVSGAGHLDLENERIMLASPCLLWLPSGKTATLTLRAGSSGAWLAVGDVAFGQVPLPPNIAEDLSRVLDRPLQGVHLDASLARRLAAAFGGIEAERLDVGPDAQDMIRHLLAVFFIALWRLSEAAPREPLPLPRVIVGNFLQLVDLNMHRHWSVNDYATHLGVSSDRLNTAVQRALGRTPLALIHARLVAEARQLLEGSSLQIAETAALLGFEDPAYFSRFFKRLTGKSPRRYRMDFVNSQTRMAGSFAAWP